ncbi:uncharacterized protein si:dkey-63d15.12 isoform X3 [Ictalurus furcatus]|nr:uncharacterized protein si:dkey-63d15.12 isoform X3 [Ictalurus furcatus]XP_053479955.1 uncharacterized protein si:dkey-63d15.12 isoform X3 [Ictalurus furcatus]XP_053479956.1 uncharacterized protein si:dkey-63d15.12 isoform X3 [Ictalurus furcatus]XP_053479957.1 uncharacterized protein si:dkey-63d15.12 isoform X3 [Ictalurus furcatus]
MTHTRRAAHLLFLIVFLTGCVCGLNLSVWQTPRNITAESGERVTLTCHFTLRTSERGGWKLQWRKNNDSVFLTESYNISDINTNTVTEVNKSHTLTLHPVNVSHSGIYYCKVWQDVPRLGPETEGGGTELTVDNNTNNSSSTPSTPSTSSIPSSTPATDQDVKLVIWMASLALLLIIACVTSVMCFTYRGHCVRPKLKTDRQSARAEDLGVVYAAVKIHKPREKKHTHEVRTLTSHSYRSADLCLCEAAVECECEHGVGLQTAGFLRLLG